MIRVMHLASENIPERSVYVASSIQHKPIALCEQGREVRKAGNVVPMRMGQKDVSGDLRAAFQIVAKLSRSRAYVEDKQRARIGTDLDARSVATMTTGRWVRDRYKPACPPEPDEHSGSVPE